jgi:hypothetical protein
MLLARVEFFLGLCLLIAAYFISHTINGILQAITTNALGDPTAKQEGYLSIDPMKHFNPFGFFIGLIMFGIGWFQTVPINTNAFIGRGRYLKMGIALFSETFYSIGLAIASLTVSIGAFGPEITLGLIQRVFPFYSWFIFNLFSKTAALNLATLFTNQPAITIVLSSLLITITYLNVFIALFSIIHNAFRFIIELGFDKGYSYIEYADYLFILGPLLVLIVFGDSIQQALFMFTYKSTLILSVLFGLL